MAKKLKKLAPQPEVVETVETTAVDASVDASTELSPEEGLDRSRSAGAPDGAGEPNAADTPETSDNAETQDERTDSAAGQADADASAVEPALPSATNARRPLPISLPRVLLDGIVRKNPVLVAGLGLVPALLLADAAAALAVGVCTTLALLVTSLAASLCGQYLPEKFRPALFTLIAAGAAVALEFAIGELLPDLMPRIGIFVALIAVGGLTLSRAEYSTARPPLDALVDAFANGIGYTLALTLIGALREIVGRGSIFGVDVTFGVLPPMNALTTAAGGFILVGLLAGAIQGLRLSRARRRAAKVSKKSNDKEVSA